MFALLVDILLVVHAGFIVFVVLGGLLLFRWPQLIWLHLPAAAWGAAVELGRWTCPLTLLENHVRTLAGLRPYEGGFIAHHLQALIYPPGLTPMWQLLLGTGVIAVNVLVYRALIRRRARVMATGFER